MELTDLPNEILHHIISRIPLSSDLATVVALSRRFKTLAEPLLYRKVHLHAEPLEESRLGFLPVLKRTDRLIANLKARPELGKHTTSFSVRVTHFLWWQTYPHVSIIKRMPQLRQLSYDPPAVHGASLPEECKRLSDLRLDFRHVTNHYDEDSNSWLEHGIPLQIIAKNLWHPPLRKLQAERIALTPRFEYKFWLVEQRQRRGFPPVDDLRFLDCSPRINYNVMSSFITTIKHLKCFVLDVVKPRDPSVTAAAAAPHDENPNQIDLRPALDTHRTTIHTLALSTSDRALDVFHLSGSLTFWTSLKRLALPYPEDRTHYPFLHRILPPQLQELQLQKRIWAFSTYDAVLQYETMPGDELTQFLEFAKNKERFTPGLKRLVWWFQHPAGQGFEGANYRLLISTVEMFAGANFGEVGVRFEVVTTPFFRETPLGRRLCKW